MHLNEIVTEAHATAKEKGWWSEPRGIPELLCLVHSEISEALEAYRDGQTAVDFGKDNKPEGLPIELADAVVRICDIAGHLGIDLENCIKWKMTYNKTRAHRHGGKAA